MEFREEEYKIYIYIDIENIFRKLVIIYKTYMPISGVFRSVRVPCM